MTTELPESEAKNMTSNRVPSSAWLGSVFVISWDRDPQPWEDWSFPFRVIVGTEEEARAHAGKLQEERGGLFSVQEVKGEGTPILFLPNVEIRGADERPPTSL